MLTLPVIISIIVATVVLFFVILAAVAAKYRVVVPTNMVHIVNSSSGRRVYGNNKDNVQGNTYYAFPDWLPKIGVNVTTFPISNFGVELNNYVAYDHKQLPFQVDVQAFFVMEDADVVSQRVATFEELQLHLRKIVSGAVRKVTASKPLEDILSARATLSNSFAEEVSDQLKAWGVKSVNSIEFMNIQDTSGSNVISDIKAKEESRINRESRETTTENDRSAQVTEIEAKREIALKTEEAARLVGQQMAAKEKDIGIAKEKSKQAVAEEARTTAEKQAEVNRVNETARAIIAKEVAVTEAEQRKSELVIQSEAEKAQVVLQAEAARQALEAKAKGAKISVELQAEAELYQADKQAEGIKKIKEAEALGISKEGQAKAEAEKQMQLASVTAQTTLAAEIGENQSYQKYLLEVRLIESQEKVGVAQAKALENADIQIIGGGKGSDTGLNLGSALAGFVATEAGGKLLSRITGQ